MIKMEKIRSVFKGQLTGTSDAEVQEFAAHRGLRQFGPYGPLISTVYSYDGKYTGSEAGYWDHVLRREYALLHGSEIVGYVRAGDTIDPGLFHRIKKDYMRKECRDVEGIGWVRLL